MEIRVKKAKGSDQETTSTLSLTAGLKVPERVKSRIKSDVGDYLKEQILLSASAAKSPIAGEGSFEKLSPAYKKKKEAEGLPGKANLELEGDMLDALDYEETNDGIAIGWWGKEAGKADGHANLSGDSSLPQRRLIPDVGQEFVSDIQDGIEQIVADAIADETEFDPADFQSIDTRSQLYDVLDQYFPSMSRIDIKGIVARSPDLANLLDDLGLLDLL